MCKWLGGGRGGCIGVGPPIKKWGYFFVFFYSARGREGGGGGGYRGGPYKRMGVHFFLQLSRGPKGPSKWPKATSPAQQELEVGARRAPYLLVLYTRRYGALQAPTSSSCGGLVAFGHLEGPSGPPYWLQLVTLLGYS